MAEKQKQQIIRTPTFAGGGITPEEQQKMRAIAKEWEAIAVRTAPIEPDKIVPAIKSLYAVAGLKEPRIVIVPSPRVLAFAGGIALGVWEARARGVPEQEIEEARVEACSFLSSVGSGGGVLGPIARSWIEALPGWCYCYQGGAMWAGFPAYACAVRDVLGIPLPAWQPWEDCARHGGFRFLHAEFCLVSDFPEKLERDAQNRPHCADGPSHRWRDGWELYYWHGVAVPKHVVMAPETITVEQINAEDNVEVRRVFVERYGEERYIIDAGLAATDYDESLLGGATLYYDEAAQIAKVRVVNSTPEPDGTYRVYWLSVNPTLYGGDAGRYARAAVASTWRTTPGGEALAFPDWRDYRPEVET